MDSQNARNQIKTKIGEATNILVTVGQNPSIDELTAALGLTLAIDKMRKHSSAIFSGAIPHIMKFLHPERTFEDSTASFRDFIISLDKEKADKLRYKVEGDLVKIFITPYHTKLSPDDLVFSEGELNVDLVIGIGVRKQNDLDQALFAHGRILHDATIATINLDNSSSLGSITWTGIGASGYSEAIAEMVAEIDEKLLTKQISTALLTGIVLATDQFSNARTQPATMAIASKLLASGADQQLIVAEIRGSGNVAETPVEVIQEIPEVEPAVIPAATNVVSELEALPPAEPDLDAVRSSLDAYLPPPLPDFQGGEALPPTPAPAEQTPPPAIFPTPELPAEQPEPAPEPTAPNTPPPDDLAQFKIPI
ncbi:hypothetical protein FACS189431_7140 [Alphaproteobacteria bacterium]|nr:hypothetical protein FACS189431_7140 [Alphaproteobacteria bacterium]